ncbi:hypothetical protein H2199_008103 [Coniosporium tulheliwenetii]|uniref:Uncharacterized protein n=1 Tax=Coniosporium tulheliwenetii TaxID=3383036 RepID=A0ACC2YM58_9PEZI|nr:hypothetical protein H2199_008103 [Cladosporium sp. JES 115]
MSGFNTLMYYSATLFDIVGFSNPVAVGLVVAGGNFFMTWINMMTVDPFGRRRVLVCTVWGMSAGLLAVAVAFSFIPVNTETLEVQDRRISAPAIVVLVFIIWFVLFYGVSVGNTAWMSTDFFPMEVLIFFYPEVSGLTLEETAEVFQHGFGVRYARKLRKERKDIIKARKEYEKQHGGGTIAMGH